MISIYACRWQGPCKCSRVVYVPTHCTHASDTPFRMNRRPVCTAIYCIIHCGTLPHWQLAGSENGEIALPVVTTEWSQC